MVFTMERKQRGQSGLFKTVALSAIIAAGFTVLTAFTLPDRETVEHITAAIPEEIARIAEETREKLEPVPETESKTETEQEAPAPETKPAEESEPAEVTQPETVEEMIYRYCAAYGVDYNLALAIARLETGHFTSAAYVNGNNIGGLSVNEIPLTYATREEGVKAYVENLTTYYAAGLTTPETIQPVYCPGNESWAAVVRQLMQ